MTIATKTKAAPAEPCLSYVCTTDGIVLVQVPSTDARSGFYRCDDDQSWDGGLGIATEWVCIPTAEVSPADRERLDWLLQEAFDQDD